MNKRKINSIITYIILTGGVLVRLFYVLLSSIYDRQYDIGQIDILAGPPVSGGHLGYIQYLYYYGALPDVDPTTVYQFHHPPVHHILSAIMMRFTGLFTNNPAIIQESIQIIPLIASVITLFVAYRLLNMVFAQCLTDVQQQNANAINTGFNIALALFAFHPALVLLSGSVNNDCLALMFTFLCIYFFIRWTMANSWFDICALALCLGLGISTKQNVAELAFPIGLIFLIFLVKEYKTKLGLLISQYATFGIISIPLGMWFYIRNLLRYNMSITWVYELPTDTWQYTGNYPVINRFLWPIPSEMIDNLTHFRIGCGYNIWMQIMRTSVLGEWDMASVGTPIKLIAVLLMLSGACLAILAFVGFCRTFIIDSQLKPVFRIFFITTYAVIMAFYMVFVYKYPQECSMNFRYIEVTLLLQIPGLGLLYNSLRTKWTKVIINILVIGFILLSLAMCGVWCIN